MPTTNPEMSMEEMRAVVEEATTYLAPEPIGGSFGIKRHCRSLLAAARQLLAQNEKLEKKNSRLIERLSESTRQFREIAATCLAVSRTVTALNADHVVDANKKVEKE